MNILVTGGCGFIGSHAVDALLDRGHKVVVVDNRSTGNNDNDNALQIKADVSRVSEFWNALLTSIGEEKFDVVVHLAAQTEVGRSMREPAWDAQQNIIHTLRIAELCIEHGTPHLVFASSGGAIYGEPNWMLTQGFFEDHLHKEPTSFYGLSKLTCERYLKMTADRSGLAVTSLRYGNVYGPRQRPGGEAGVVAIFIDKMLRGESPTINGDGECVRDYVYVDDVAQVTRIAAENFTAKGFEAYNVGTGIGTSVNELHQIIAEELEFVVGQPVYGPPQDGDLRWNVLNCDKTIRDLGAPNTNLRNGIAKTVEWMRSDV